LYIATFIIENISKTKELNSWFYSLLQPKIVIFTNYKEWNSEFEVNAWLGVSNKKGGISLFRLSDLTTVPYGTGTKSKS